MRLYNRSKVVLFRRANVHTLTHVQLITGSNERITEMLQKQYDVLYIIFLFHTQKSCDEALSESSVEKRPSRNA